MNAKQIVMLAAIGGLTLACNRSSGGGGVETKIDILPVTFRAELQTDQAFYAFGEPIQVRLALSNFSSATVFGSNPLECGGATPIVVQVLDSTNQIVFSTQADCLDPIAHPSLKSGETLNRSLIINDGTGSPSVPLPLGDYLITASIDLRGPLPEANACYSDGIATVCAPGALSVARVPIQVVRDVGPAPLQTKSSASALSLAPQFRILAQADRPFYAAGQTAKIQSVIENQTGQDIYGIQSKGCGVDVEIFAVHGINLDSVKGPKICTLEVLPVTLLSGSNLKSSLELPLVDNGGQILPEGFYVIRITSNVEQISTTPVAPGAYQGPNGGSAADLRPSVDIAVRIF